ncbi:MAG: hypothetical protein IIA55_14675 [Gemmatimonadetes bacterium]|nr:hypothetical protein [Gemmatimonadota bacterium]
MSFSVRFNKNRTSDDVLSLFETDGTTSVTLAASDVVRFKIYRRDQATPVLDLDSAAPSSNDSKITVDELGPSPTASVTIRVSQADALAIDPGVYSAEVSVVDDSETDPANAIKHFQNGYVFMAGTGGGDIGLT